ncbi:MAG: zinc-binding dehydrogenase [Actinomycetota bacterium]
MENLPDLMTAAVTTGHGGPEVVEVRNDWPRPSPGPGQVLVRVTAAGVNNTDIWTREGAYGSSSDPNAVAGWRGVPIDFPRIQGGDVAGVIAEVGKGVERSLVGQRVLVDPAAEYDDLGHPSAIVGSEVDGGFADFHISSVDQIHDVSSSPLSDEQLACLPIAYATAMGMIEAAGCQQDERVLVTGASGGVGLAAVQILSAQGCHVVAYTSTSKEEAVTVAGASEVFLRDRDPLSEVREVDVVLDVVGGTRFGEVVDRLRTGGRLTIAGAIAGPLVELDLRRIYLRHRKLIGSTMHTRPTFAGVVEMARQGTVSPLVAETFSLKEIRDAHARFGTKNFVGKLVVVPTQE